MLKKFELILTGGEGKQLKMSEPSAEYGRQ